MYLYNANSNYDFMSLSNTPMSLLPLLPFCILHVTAIRSSQSQSMQTCLPYRVGATQQCGLRGRESCLFGCECCSKPAASCAAGTSQCRAPAGNALRHKNQVSILLHGPVDKPHRHKQTMLIAVTADVCWHTITWQYPEARS